MKKGFIQILCILLSMVMLTSCSSKPTDFDNKNINTDSVIKNISEIDFFYDSTSAMGELSKDKNFIDIVYSAYSTASDIWGSCTYKFYKVNDTLTECSNSLFSTDFKTAENYSGHSNQVLQTAFSQINSENISVIISDPANQLDDYAGLSRTIIDNVLSKDLAISVIGVETSVRPFLIFVVGDNENLSKYITAFKAKPNVMSYSGYQNLPFQEDRAGKINYQVIAKSSGILGIDYKNIQYVENGILYKHPENPAQPPQGMPPQHAPGQPPQPPMGQMPNGEPPMGMPPEIPGQVPHAPIQIGENIYQEVDGSFSAIRAYYDEDALNTIEGTIHFTPNTQRFAKISTKQINKALKADFKKQQTENAESTENIELKQINTNDITYLGVKSLVNDENAGLAGKIKLEIPFKIIDGVKLSKLDCDVVPTLYTIKQGKFVEYSGDFSKYLTTTIADGVIPQQGKWRVNDQNNSLIFNIMLPNAAKLPTNKDVVKLNVTFNHYATINNISLWVREWDNSKIPNLLNFFNSIYAYQSNQNQAQNTFTIYISKSDKRTYKAALRESVNELEAS